MTDTVTPLTPEEIAAQYDAELIQFGIDANDFPSYRRHMEKLAEHYEDPKPGWFKRLTNQAYRQTAITNGFPDYTKWLAEGRWQTPQEAT